MKSYIKLIKEKPLIIFGFIIFLWIITPLVISYFYTPQERGVFGDMYGSINALFSGLALFGIVVSIFIQQNELEIQREDLKETRLVFHINRITNIIYKQLERLETKLKGFNFYVPQTNGPYNVNQTFERDYYWINENYEIIKSHKSLQKKTPRNSYEEIRDGFLFSDLINRNKITLRIITTAILESLEIINVLLKKSSLRDEDKINTIMLFFRNLDIDLQIMLSNLNDYFDEDTISKEYSTNGIEDNDISILKHNLERIMEIVK